MSGGSAGWRVLTAAAALADSLFAQELLSEVAMIDKGPRLATDSVVWTTVAADTPNLGQVTVLDPSEGTVVLHNCITNRTSEVGPGFFPDVDIYTVGADTIERVAYAELESGATGDVFIKSAERDRHGATSWTTTNLNSYGFDLVMDVRVERDVTVWVAPDGNGVLRVWADVPQPDIQQTLSDAAFHAFRPQLTRLANGNVLVVWDEYRGSTGALDYEVFESVFDIQALQWSVPVNRSNAPQSAEFCAQVCPVSDGIWYAWTTDQGLSGDAQYRRRTFVMKVDDLGNTLLPGPFPATEQLPGGGPALGFVDYTSAGVRSSETAGLQVAPDGKVWLFVTQFDKNVSALNKEILFGHYNDDAWSSPSLLVDAERDEVALDVEPLGMDLLTVYQINRKFAPAQVPDSDMEIELVTVDADEPPFLALDLTIATPPAGSHVSYGAPSLPTERLLTLGDDEYRLAFADLHSHTNQSPDGMGRLDVAVHWARDVARLDAWANTDHDSLLNHPYLDYEYETARRLLALFDTATFTAYMGFEWTSQDVMCVPGMTGDVVLPQLPDGCDLMPGTEAVGHRATFDASAVIRNRDPLTDDLCEYYEAMLLDDAIGVPHHLGQPMLAPPSFEGGCFNAIVQPVTEVKSVHGIFEPELASKLRDSGKRFGVIASGDDHGARPGLDGIAGVWMLEEQGGVPVGTPQRDRIKDALRARRCFANDKDGTWVDFRINGAFMGEELTVTAGTPLTASYEIKNVPFKPSPNDRVTVSILDALVTPYPPSLLIDAPHAATFNPVTPVTNGSASLGVAQGNAVYILRVTQAAGGVDNLASENTIMWSSPIWIDVQ